MTSNELSSTGAIQTSVDTHPSPAKPTGSPWFTWLAVIACIGIFLGLTSPDHRDVLNSLRQFGYRDANDVWDGASWALVTSTFIHLELWHIAFNLYWLWVLGSHIERQIGTLRFAAFYIGAAFVSSAYQLAASDSVGIGASGVGYALFGFMWQTREQFPSFKTVLSRKTTQLFIMWLIGCYVVTAVGMANIGNAAHTSGLLFGCAIAHAFVCQNRPRFARAALVAMTFCAVTSLYWCPWSLPWQMHQAYREHVAQKYEKAIGWYSSVIRRDPGNSWAYFNRGYAYMALDRLPEAQADLKKGHELDPNLPPKTELDQPDHRQLNFP